MCTGNVYCNQISPAAVETIAVYLGILPEVVEETAHVFEPGIDWQELVVEQNASPEHPQTAYRQLLCERSLWIFNGHACVETEVD